MSTAIAVVQTTLDELRDEANREHDLAESSLNDAVAHAIRCGEALNEIREIVPRGEWVQWIRDNFNGATNTAYVYRRMASHQGLIADSTSVSRAMRAIRATPGTSLNRGSLIEHADDMRELRKSGMTCAQVAEVFECSAPRVHILTTPGSAHAQRERLRKYQVQHRAEQRAWKREQEAKAMKAEGGPLSLAYGLLRKMELAVAAARDSAVASESKADLAQVLSRLGGIEDLMIHARKANV